MLMAPRSTMKLPATAFSSVDFPEPFVPMTMTNDPSSICSDTPLRARTSFGVPSKNVFRNSRSCSMPFHFLQERRHDERAEDEQRRDELQVIRIQSPSQREGDDQSKEHRAQDRARERGADAVRSDQGPADDDAGRPPDDHADTHRHVA